MDGTILGKGSFVATGNAVTIAVPSATDVLEVYNYTQAAASASGNGFYYLWDPNMGSTSVVYSNGTANAATVGVTGSGAFTVYNGVSAQGALNNGSTGVSAWSNATPPVITVGSTTGMSAGMVVRFSNLSGTNGGNQCLAGYNGLDFSIGYGTAPNGTQFSVDYLGAAGGAVTVTSGNFTVIGYAVTTTTGLGIITTDGYWYPRRRYITKMASSGTSTVITLSVQHNFTVGQEIRLQLPGGKTVWGSWYTLDNYSYPTGGTASTTPNSYIITAVDTATGTGHNSITINANSSGFAAWSYAGGALTGNTYANSPFPSANPLYTPASVIPVGEDTSTALNANLSSLADAQYNVGFLGVTLAGGNGTSNPAGGLTASVGDTVYWYSRKCTFGGL
jgi:hypothetical protein